MAVLISGNGNLLIRALTAMEKIPLECHDVKISSPADGAMMLTYKVFMTNEDLIRLADIMGELAEDEKP